MDETYEFPLSPLQLEKYYIKEFWYSVKDEFVDRELQKEEIVFPSLLAKVEKNRSEDDPRHWRFELSVKSNDEISKDFPYALGIILIGFFNISEDYPEERVDILATVNGPSLLYSAAREAIVTMTSRTLYPAVVLPSIMFLPSSTAQDQQEQKQLLPSGIEAFKPEEA